MMVTMLVGLRLSAKNEHVCLLNESENISVGFRFDKSLKENSKMLHYSFEKNWKFFLSSEINESFSAL